MSTFPHRTFGDVISHKQTNVSTLRNILIASTVDYSKISCSPSIFFSNFALELCDTWCLGGGQTLVIGRFIYIERRFMRFVLGI